MEDLLSELRNDALEILSTAEAPSYRRVVFIASNISSSTSVYIEHCIEAYPNPLTQFWLQLFVANGAREGVQWWSLAFAARLLLSNLDQPSMKPSTSHQALSALLRICTSHLRSGNMSSVAADDEAEVVANYIASLLKAQTSLCLHPDRCKELSVNLLELYHVPSTLYYVPLPGPRCDLKLLRDALVLDIALPPFLPDPLLLQNISIAIFDCSLDFSLSNSAHLELDYTSGALEDAQQQAMKHFATMLSRSGVLALFSQRLIHPTLQLLLSRLGIVAIPSVSIRFIGALQRMSGALLLGQAALARLEESVLDVACTGQLAAMYTQRVHGKWRIVVEGRRDAGRRTSLLSSVLVTAPTEGQRADLQAVCEDTLATLRTSPRAMARAHWREELCGFIRGHEMYGVTDLATRRCVEAFCRALLVQKDAEDHCLLLENCVVGLTAAVEAVVHVMDIGSVVHVAPTQIR